MEIMHKYEEKVKEKWEDKQREVRIEEFNKYGEYVQIERTELKRQLQDLEQKYLNQI